MLEKLHDHIIEELKTNTKTDIIFILTSIMLNFIALGVNSLFASGTDWDPITDESIRSVSDYINFVLFMILIIIINSIVIFGLRRGRTSRSKLLSGLLKLYQDQDIAGYYDESLLSTYNVRYTLFITAVVSTGAIGFLVPLILMIF